MGLALSGCSLTTVYHYNFENNEAQVVIDKAYGTKWDNGSPGGENYWGGYNGTDNNSDGSGDSAYKVTQYYNDKDNYPLMNNFVVPEFPIALIFVVLVAVVTAMLLASKRRSFSSRKA